jgi:hypothetical protein
VGGGQRTATSESCCAKRRTRFSELSTSFWKPGPHSRSGTYIRWMSLTCRAACKVPRLITLDSASQRDGVKTSATPEAYYARAYTCGETEMNAWHNHQCKKLQDDRCRGPVESGIIQDIEGRPHSSPNWPRLLTAWRRTNPSFPDLTKQQYPLSRPGQPEFD